MIHQLNGKRGANVTLCIHDANLHLGERVHWHRGDWKRSILSLGGAHLQSFGRELALYWGPPYMGYVMYILCQLHMTKSLAYFQIISILSLTMQPEWSFWKTIWVTAPHLPYILTFCLTPEIKNNNGVICPQGPARSGFCPMLTLPQGSPFTSLNACSFCCYYCTC